MGNYEFILRLLVAFLLGSALGLERQWRQRMAGLLTNSLVSVGATLFVSLSDLMQESDSPSRIAAQVVSGIGYLAGGVILREGLTVRGLNTAATLWCAAAIGALTGAGFLSQAFLGAIAVLLCHILLTPLGDFINKQPLRHTEIEVIYQCVLICNNDAEADIRQLLLQSLNTIPLKLNSLYSHPLKDDEEKTEIIGEVISLNRSDHIVEKVISQLSVEPSVVEVSWQVTERHHP